MAAWYWLVWPAACEAMPWPSCYCLLHVMPCHDVVGMAAVMTLLPATAIFDRRFTQPAGRHTGGCTQPTARLRAAPNTGPGPCPPPPGPGCPGPPASEKLTAEHPALSPTSALHQLPGRAARARAPYRCPPPAHVGIHVGWLPCYQPVGGAAAHALRAAGGCSGCSGTGSGEHRCVDVGWQLGWGAFRF